MLFRSFINFSEQYQKIKELFKQEFNKSEALRQIIENICRESNFILSNKKKNYFKGNYKIQDEDDKEDKNIKKRKLKKKIKKFKNITFKELQDWNIKIQITKKIIYKDKEKPIITLIFHRLPTSKKMKFQNYRK